MNEPSSVMKAKPTLQRWAYKVIVFVAAGVVCGAFQHWAISHTMHQREPAGFGYGLIHGALMPMALPALLVGQDVPIYIEPNTGRTYKLGYIAGINACGMLFFGMAFWRPRPPPQKSQ